MRSAWTAYLDIETAGLERVVAEAAATTRDPQAAVDEASAAALTPLRGRVVCWAVVTSDDREAVECDLDERAMLARLADFLEGAARIVAYNGHAFDFPYLRARALHHRLPHLAWQLWQEKPWGSRLVDPLAADWCPRPPHSTKGWTLDALADLLGVVRPVTLPGKEIPAAFYVGRHDEIRAHCLDDVRTLRAVTLRLAEQRERPVGAAVAHGGSSRG